MQQSVTTAFAKSETVTATLTQTEVKAEVLGSAVAVRVKPVSETSRRAEAKLKGYEGESCRECGNFTLVRNGTCLKCDTCGGTSGCS
jgi:ribonucleoside-diphosphate reductase alpha chain